MKYRINKSSVALQKEEKGFEKFSCGVRIFLCVLSAVLCISVVSCGNNPDEKLISGENYSFNAAAVVYYMAQTAGSITEEEMEKHGYDDNKKLDEQMYDDEHTWYELIMERTIDTMRSMLIICEAAYKDGYALDSSDTQYINSVISEYRIRGVAAGNLGIDEYLKKVYNYDITEADLTQIITLSRVYDRYTEKIYDKIAAEVTDSEIEKYISENMTNPDRSNTRRLGHILLANERYDEDSDAIKEKADKLIAELQADGVTLESFIKSAEENSDSNEFFFENVGKGDMMKAMDEWIYADGRKIGDIGFVSSKYGGHILYYAADGEQRCVSEARISIATKKYQEWYSRQASTTKINVKQKKIYAIKTNN